MSWRGGFKVSCKLKRWCRRRVTLLLWEHVYSGQVLQVCRFNFCAALSFSCAVSECSTAFYASGINKASSMRSHICNFWSTNAPLFVLNPLLLLCTRCSMCYYACFDHKIAFTWRFLSRALGALGMRILKVMKLSMMHKDHSLQLSPYSCILDPLVSPTIRLNSSYFCRKCIQTCSTVYTRGACNPCSPQPEPQCAQTAERKRR